jgi:hypothetical protein
MRCWALNLVISNDSRTIRRGRSPRQSDSPAPQNPLPPAAVRWPAGSAGLPPTIQNWQHCTDVCIALERLIRDCWAKVEWGYGRILVRDGANAGWINYMLKDRQKSQFDGFVDCIIIESLHNPIADA